MADRDEVINALEEVMDPELMIDIWTLELIYDLEVEEDTVDILMTYTTPMCPYGPQLKRDIRDRLTDIDEVEEVNIEVTFEPRWEPSEELRAMLGV